MKSSKKENVECVIEAVITTVLVVIAYKVLPKLIYLYDTNIFYIYRGILILISVCLLIAILIWTFFPKKIRILYIFF